MKKLDSDSYIIGFIECLFLCTKTIDESQAIKYMETTTLLGFGRDSQIMDYIETNYPNL